MKHILKITKWKWINFRILAAIVTSIDIPVITWVIKCRSKYYGWKMYVVDLSE